MSKKIYLCTNNFYTLLGTVSSYTKQLKSEISKLDDKVATLKNQLETTTKGLMKSSNINRWIVIAGVVILAVLMFVVK